MEKGRASIPESPHSARVLLVFLADAHGSRGVLVVRFPGERAQNVQDTGVAIPEGCLRCYTLDWRARKHESAPIRPETDRACCVTNPACRRPQEALEEEARAWWPALPRKRLLRNTRRGRNA